MLIHHLQVVGNLLYYRYVNPAIIAPEAFDVLEVAKSDEVDRTSLYTTDHLMTVPQITIVQRRNLASIAKVLQFAASNQRV